MSSFMSPEEKAEFRQAERFVAGRAISYTALVVVLVAALCIIGGIFSLAVWQPWATDRQAQIQDRSRGRQDALVGTIVDNVTEYERVRAADPTSPLLIALADQICGDAARLTGTINLVGKAAEFTARNC